jgi:V-type H+-transporting ATPase subunit H
MTTPLLYAEEPSAVFDAVPSTQFLLRTKEIPWDIYMTARLISDHDLQLLRRYDKRDPEQRAKLLEDAGPLYVAALLSVLKNVTKDETVQYVLALLDDMLESNSSSAALFHQLDTVSGANDGAGSSAGDAQGVASIPDPYSILLRLLQRNDWFTDEKAALILAAVLDARPDKADLGKALAEGAGQRDLVARTVAAFLEWTLGQLRHPSHPTRGIPTAMHCLAVLLREVPVRAMFCRTPGAMQLLIPLVGMPAPGVQLNIQLLYETMVCVWELSFYPPAIDTLAVEPVVAGLVDVVRLAQKEKLVRASLLALKNLLGQGDHPALEFAVVEKGLHKVVATKLEQNWDDEDVPNLLEWMQAHLEAGALALTSLERYRKEVMSGHLRKSPLHDSDAFWLENAQHLADNNSALLRGLLRVMEGSRDPVALAVACKDLSQFVTYYPHGRGIVSELKGKELAMRLMAHPDADVQSQALVCVQRLLLSRDKVEFMAQAS